MNKEQLAKHCMTHGGIDLGVNFLDCKCKSTLPHPICECESGAKWADIFQEICTTKYIHRLKHIITIPPNTK